MKILVLLLLPLYAFCQIPKGTDRIEIATAMTDSVAYESLLNTLSKEGYVIARENTKRKEIVTEYKPTKYAWRLRVLSGISQGVITLRGQCATEVLGTKIENEPIAYKGMGGAMNKLNFEYLNKLAIRIKEQSPSATISYPIPDAK